MTIQNKLFEKSDQQTLLDIMMHRRDIRGNNFTQQAISSDDLDKILLAASIAPSVGLSQPWQFVIIKDQKTKQQISENFHQENNKAAALINDQKKALYQSLKLEGIKEAPINIAVFYQQPTSPILGQNSMPETGEYSVVCAIQNMWLMARALNIGLGWVSILEPQNVANILNAPADYKLVAYLCLGHVKQFFTQPELELVNWQKRQPINIKLHQEYFENS